MAYKPKNVAKYREDSSTSSRGSGGTYPGMVPGATGSEDRESQLNSFLGNGNHGNVNEVGSDFSIMDGGNDRLDPRKKDSFGQASYSYNKPTLIP